MQNSILYNKESIRFFDQQMIEHYVDSGYQLMTQAAQSVLDVINQHYPKLQYLLIFCGQGNNAGDGYVLARLAKRQNIIVQLVNLADTDRLKGDALLAYQDWLNVGGTITPLREVNYSHAQLIVDALIGTGLDRPLNSQWLGVVNTINQANLPVLAVDIPSGLDANTGATWGGAVKAKQTVTFIGLKQGMYTAQAREYCGEIIFKSLGVPIEIYQQRPSTFKLLQWTEQLPQLPKRTSISHKGEHGKVLIIGGNRSMPGAVSMAGEAALRSGAGLVKIITHRDNLAIVAATRPELMVTAIDDPHNSQAELQQLLEWADSIAIGPGLGNDNWSKALLNSVLLHNQPKVLDADALNLLAQMESAQLSNAVLTPHPGEAARLLDRDIYAIEGDRYSSAKQLQEKYQSTIVLKGAGTLVATQQQISVCPYGNAGMASGGMGDCLTGILATLLNQIPSPSLAAQLAVSLHAKAADQAAKEGTIGLLASDLMSHIRNLINS